MSDKATYQHSPQHYAKLYNVTERTIYRWIDDGLPLDDQEAILLAKGKPAAENETVPHRAANGPKTSRKAKAGALGLSASIERLQAAEAQAHAEYIDAVASGSEAKTATKQKQWLALSEQLRKVEQSAPDVAEQNKNSVRLVELQSTLNELFTRLRQDLDTLPKRIALELVGQDAIGIEQALKREVEEVILSLFKCSYLEAGNGQ